MTLALGYRTPVTGTTRAGAWAGQRSRQRACTKALRQQGPRDLEQEEAVQWSERVTRPEASRAGLSTQRTPDGWLVAGIDSFLGVTGQGTACQEVQTPLDHAGQEAWTSGLMMCVPSVLPTQLSGTSTQPFSQQRLTWSRRGHAGSPLQLQCGVLLSQSALQCEHRPHST